MSSPRGGSKDHNGGWAENQGPSGPRVVIFEGQAPPRIEVVDLPGKTSIGTRICHRGTSWLVTGLRTHDRVIICSPAEA